MLLINHRNYLRVRGEYSLSLGILSGFGELPPRARRILCKAWGVGTRPGTTSACAENTDTWRLLPIVRRNYLRVRGEYDAAGTGALYIPELPPRARRILYVVTSRAFPLGTTSACAENTMGHHGDPTTTRNYLRVRGEYASPVGQ